MSQPTTPDPEQFLLRLNAAVDAYLEHTKGQRPHGTKTWLAQQLSCDRTTLYKYLDGTNRIPLDTLQMLTRLIGLGPDEANSLLFLGGYGVAVPVALPPPPAEPVLTPSSLRAALADALPEALQGALGDQLSLIAGLLDDIRKGQLGGDDLTHALAADPTLSELGRALAGREVQAGNTVVNFGSGNHLGDIRMRDVAGRDIIRLVVRTGDIHVYHFHGGSQAFFGGTAPPPITPPLAPTGTASTIKAPNPFGRRGRIDNPDEFFGREELLRRIFEELGKGSNLSLIGEREIGKSSLLCMIQRQGSERLGLPNEAILHIDMQLVHSEDDFFEALCAELGLVTCRGYRLARQLRGKRYILCLDEIEKMRRDRFSADVRDELRGLADGASAPLTLVVASGVPLAELFPDKLGEVSPLANICSPLEVPRFSRAEARAFLMSRLMGSGINFSEDETTELLEESGRHPSRLQQAAAELYRRKVGG